MTHSPTDPIMRRIAAAFDALAIRRLASQVAYIRRFSHERTGDVYSLTEAELERLAGNLERAVERGRVDWSRLVSPPRPKGTP